MLGAATMIRNNFRVDGNDIGDVVEQLIQATGALPQISLDYDRDRKLLWITMRPEPKPVLTLQMINSLSLLQVAI